MPNDTQSSPITTLYHVWSLSQDYYQFPGQLSTAFTDEMGASYLYFVNNDDTPYDPTSFYVFDVTDTSQVKLRFDAGSIGTNSKIFGDTARMETNVFFMKLGAT